MNDSNIKRYPITNMYIDLEGNEQPRASYLDFESLPSRHIDILATVIPGFEKDKELLEKLGLASDEYEKGNYEASLKYLNWLLRKESSLEPFLYYYKKICEGISLIHPFSPSIENRIRCKWCGTLTLYIDPNASTFGLFSDSNSCSSCGRMYPMPSWLWDSPDGRAYSYYRESFIDEKFYEEFEEDYEPKPLCKRRQKIANVEILDAEGFYNRGFTQVKLGDYSNALLNFTQTIKLNPKFAPAYINRGSVKSYLGDIKEAIKDFDKGIDINPNDAAAYFNRGVAKNKLGDRQSEILDYNKAIELNPKLAAAYYNRGIAKDDLGDYQNAILDYDKAIELNPKFDSVFFNRGIAKYKSGDMQGAKKDYNKAIELNPLSDKAYIHLGVVKNELGDYLEAIKDYNKAIELDPKPAEAYCNRGIAKDDLGDYQNAILDYDKAIELNPKLASAYINRGLAKFNIGNKRSACQDWSKAGELGDSHAYDLIKKYCK
jgi:tetratricopeptide (TPR) repeat protein